MRYIWKINDEQPEMIQQISCDINIREAEIHCEDLNFDTYPDLQILCTGESEEAGKGYLYLWDRKNKVFAENYIELPTEYEQVTKMGTIAIVLTEQNEDTEIRRICKVDEEWGELVTIREWTLEKQSGHLKIYDCYSEQVLFDGMMGNEKYYEYLFWQDILPVIYHDASDSGVLVWSGEHYGEEYLDKEAFLEACGFKGEDPFFIFRDSLGNIKVELYFDEENDRGCGIHYAWRYIDKGIESVYMAGFTFDKVSEAAWKEPDPYSLLSIKGTDGSGGVDDYTENTTYTQDGKIDSFYSEGMIDWLVDDRERQQILEIDFVYRDNGTLAYRDYWHNSYIFSSTSSSIRSLYDESERLVYEYAYITQGSIESYYIYTDESKVPLYCLELDGYVPDMIRYNTDNP